MDDRPAAAPVVPVGPVAAAAALAALLGHEAWAVVRLRDSATVTLVGGTRSEVERLTDVPLTEGVPTAGRRFDRLVAIPFRQVTERGFEAHDDGTPLTVVEIEHETEVALADLLAALPDEPVTFADRGGFDTTDEEYGVVVDAIIGERDRQRRGRQPRRRPALPGAARGMGRGQGADRPAEAARARARRVLDLLLLHRRPLPRRRQPRAARVGARRRRPDEPDQRHVPAQGPHRPRPAQAAAAGVPRRREGDLRALHGRRRGAQDDVRHLRRGRTGARTVPQADDAPGAHGVPPRRPHRPRRPRGAPRHDVRRDGDRLAGGERLPADQEVRDRGPRLLRRRARADRAGPRGPAHRRLPDRDPHRRRGPRGPAQGDRRRDPGPGLRGRARGVRDAREGGRHPRRLRARRPGDVGRRGPRRADPRRGRRDRPRLAQPVAQQVLAHRPGRLAAGRRAQGQDGGHPRRRGRLREHAAARPRGDGHDLVRRPPRGLFRRGARRLRPRHRRTGAG